MPMLVLHDFRIIRYADVFCIIQCTAKYNSRGYRVYLNFVKHRSIIILMLCVFPSYLRRICIATELHFQSFLDQRSLDEAIWQFDS